MELDLKPFEAVKASGKKMVIVTKYLDADQMKKIRSFLETWSEVIGFGENRIKALENKKLPIEKVHFIGRLQSRQIPKIVEYASVIHSLASLKHAGIINQKVSAPISIFVQVNVANDPNKEGIEPGQLPDFLEALSEFENLKVVGLSSMGWGEFEANQKSQEFKTLIDLRNQFLPEGLTSGGTSRDYPLALAAGIDVVRIGGACFNNL